ncbi:MAG TPA: hypothetical protein VHI13_01465 [Candidatus Kapabacteria bacterium]|nr:hypothetical protein [Candidatus Kapabacteria bacterium]
MMRYLSAIALFIVLASTVLHAQHRDSLHYVVQMRNGDAFRGNLVGYTDSTLTIQTEFGIVTLRKSLVDAFQPIEGPVYRRRPNHFLMPSASPNGPGGFISNYELGFLYGGFGLGYGATITMGATVVPGLALSKQLYHIGAKFTVERGADYDIAVGAAYTFLTTDQPYAHIYGVGTLPIGSGRYSAMIFYRATGREDAPIALQFYHYDTTRITIHYNGSIGAALGFDAPAFSRDDISWVGEIWNNDITRPQNTVSMLGIRINNDHLSADFGLALFSAPFIVPLTSFTWRF